jgi:hypothetical protein
MTRMAQVYYKTLMLVISLITNGFACFSGDIEYEEKLLASKL